MIDDLDQSIMTSRSDSALQHLMIDEESSPTTYHSTARLTITIIVLCISTFFYGFILTNLATFSTPTIK